MQKITEFLLTNGCSALFVIVLIEQLGLPVPASPFLIAAGALAALGHLSLIEALTVAVFASLLSDGIWFSLGRYEKELVLKLLHKFPLNIPACRTNAQGGHSRRGIGSLLIAKFVPVLNTVAPSLAGMCGLELWRFLVLDLIAALLWAGTYLSLGWIFCGELECVVAIVGRFGALIGALIILGVVTTYGKRLFFARGSFLDRSGIAPTSPLVAFEKATEAPRIRKGPRWIWIKAC